MSNTAMTRAHKEIRLERDACAKRTFIRAIIADLRALETMLAAGCFERGTIRIGAEQEMFLVDSNYQASPSVLKMLESLNDSHFTTELGAFQLEANADPQLFEGEAFSRLEAQLNTLMAKVWASAKGLGLDAILTGILPTLSRSDLDDENMVPSPRYIALSKAVSEARGSAFEVLISGLDEVSALHDTVMFEACNSSFQVHLQVEADRFADAYNLAQALAGPMLAVACNSPLLFGRHLWQETRIALFKQAVDTRSKVELSRDSAPRVNFGERYLNDSIIEMFREDIVRHRPLIGLDVIEDSNAVLERGGIPELKALRSHNGTIYRWNRACYGIIDERPHLRIENRVLPAGPTIGDEVANAAFWCGAMVELVERGVKVSRELEFQHAANNFYTAAREGISTTVNWFGGRELPVTELIRDELLPIAEAGLRRRGVIEKDIARYLGIIERRVAKRQTGARWLTNSLQRMKDEGSLSERLAALTAGLATRQRSDTPVSDWDLARYSEGGVGPHSFYRVEQVMATKLYTVQADDAVELIANIMGWEKVRHVLVEDRDRKLVGLVTSRALVRFLASNGNPQDARASDLMRVELITVGPRTPTLEAIHLMRTHKVGCLPVLQDGRVLGVMTEESYLRLASDLLAVQIRAEPAPLEH